MNNNKKNGKDEIVDNKIESAWLSECEQMVNMEIKSGS